MAKGKIPVQDLMFVVGGSIGAALVNKAVDKFLPNVSPMLKAGVPLLVGAFMTMQKKPMIKMIGFGMAAKGGASLVDAFLPPHVNGIEDYFVSDPAGQDILAGHYDEFGNYINEPAGQNILSAPEHIMAVDENGNVISGYYDEHGQWINGYFDEGGQWINGEPEGGMNAYYEEMNGNEENALNAYYPED